MSRKHKHPRLRAILNEIASLHAEIEKLSNEGIDMEQANAAFAALSTAVDNLIAKTPTPAQLSTLTQGLTDLTAKVTAATPA